MNKSYSGFNAFDIKCLTYLQIIFSHFMGARLQASGGAPNPHLVAAYPEGGGGWGGVLPSNMINDNGAPLGVVDFNAVVFQESY